MNNDEIKKMLSQDLGINHLPAEAQEQIITKLGENILKKITLETVTLLSEEARGEFDTLSQAQDNKKMTEFLKQQIPDFDNFVKKIVQQSVEDFKKIQKSL